MNALMQGRERERGADVVAVQIFFFFSELWSPVFYPYN